MSHLLSYRKGWESENLAQFLLYKFSFIAHPSHVADDIGGDFFCTLFTKIPTGTNFNLLPTNSFAIQIKSDPKTKLIELDLSNQLEYLKRLELPFFIGIVNRDDLSLTVYSGEYVPLLFSNDSAPKKLKIKLVEACDFKTWNITAPEEEKSYILQFPKIAKIMANLTDEELEIEVEKIKKVSTFTRNNIASKINDQYSFELAHTKRLYWVAGQESRKHFRKNLLKRLSEAFANLSYEYNHPEIFDQVKLLEEFNLYESHFNELKKNKLYKDLIEEFEIQDDLDLAKKRMKLLP